MTTLPRLDNNNLNYVLETASLISDEAPFPKAGSKNEEQAAGLFLNELKKFCDETSEQSFTTHPGAGTLLQKILCVLLIFCSVLFFFSVYGGFITSSAISLVINLLISAVFTYKFIFNGTAFDILTPKKKSLNVMGRRFSRSATENRVVIVTSLDAPMSLRKFAFGNGLIYILRLFGVIGNILLFVNQLLFLFKGAPLNSRYFEFWCGICFLFIPFYIISLFVMSPRKASSGLSSSIIPSAITLGVLKQFSEDAFRFDKTEVCCLITGSHYSGKAGAYAFIKKYKRIFSDIPTFFIPIEEITTTESLSVYFNDGSGVKGSADIASVIANSAENIDIKVNKEKILMSSAAYTPFAAAGFPACSLGTSKKYISKCYSPKRDVISSVKPTTVDDISSIIIETLNYYNS